MPSNKCHNHLCHNLRRFRRERNITQDEIAARLGISRSTYAYYETGKTLPNILTLERIAGFYAMTVNDLIADARRPETKR